MKSTPDSHLSTSQAQVNTEEKRVYDDPNLKLELDQRTDTRITLENLFVRIHLPEHEWTATAFLKSPSALSQEAQVTLV